tara:strand:- start:18 stop:395 length:378 start_codon:yes stop_codon:yes gene_type:complete
MSREIKFRAWNGKYMIGSGYGDWVSFDGVPYTEADKAYNTPNTEINKVKGYLLMQYTGLKDKNRKDIYEGDVLECSDGILVIEFIGGQFVGINKDKSQPIRETQNRNWFQWEIIGNIHENTELIK